MSGEHIPMMCFSSLLHPRLYVEHIQRFPFTRTVPIKIHLQPMVTPKDFAKPPEVWLSTLSMDFCVIFIHFKLPVDFPNGCQRCKDLKEQTKYLAFGLDFVLQVYGLHCVNSLV